MLRITPDGSPPGRLSAEERVRCGRTRNGGGWPNIVHMRPVWAVRRYTKSFARHTQSPVNLRTYTPLPGDCDIEERVRTRLFRAVAMRRPLGSYNSRLPSSLESIRLARTIDQ